MCVFVGSMEEFLAHGPTLPTDELVANIQFPIHAKGERVVFASYRAALRKTQVTNTTEFLYLFGGARLQCHAYINAAFQVILSSDQKTIEQARVAFGAVQAENRAGATAVRALGAEGALAGLVLSNGEGAAPVGAAIA